ncbi:MAG: alpha/beta hydrolase [Asgard group archaeon]|nr:alpha/beta hydrolase [Asgard group archaeon]
MCRKSKKVKDYRTELEKKGIAKYFTMSDGVEVRVLDFQLVEKPHEYTFILIPGFITVFQSWQKVMELLTPEFRVIYFESREKASSKVPKKMERKITFRDLAHDIGEVVNQLGLTDKKFITLASSLGGNILVKALSEKWLKPTGAVLVGPAMEFHLNWFIVFMSAIIPNFIKQTIMVPMVRWYVSVFYVNKKKEPEQLEKYMRAFSECNMRRAMPLFRKMYRHKSWDDPPKVEAPILLLGASLDKMHATEETQRVHELLPNSIFVDLGSNKATHDEPLIIEIKNFIDYLEKHKK